MLISETVFEIQGFVKKIQVFEILFEKTLKRKLEIMSDFLLNFKTQGLGEFRKQRLRAVFICSLFLRIQSVVCVMWKYRREVAALWNNQPIKIKLLLLGENPI